MKLDYPKLRDLVRMLRVVEAGALSSVAAAVGRAQQTISHSLVVLESQLHAQLFDRTPRGTFPTEEAWKLGDHVRNALGHMAEARALFLRLHGPRVRASSARIFELNIRNQQIFVFLALCDLREVKHVAYHLRSDASAVRKALRSFEAQLGIPLFDRTPRGLLEPTPFAGLLAKQMKLALAEINAGLEALQSGRGTIHGEVVFGAVAYGRYTVLPRILSRLGNRHPGLKLRQRIASYDDLVEQLACRDLDFIVGVQRKPDSPELVSHPLVTDRVEIIARVGHPLSRAAATDASSYLEFPWILPPQVVPLRRRFADCLRKRAIPAPEPSFETSDYQLVRAILADCDAVALAMRYEALADVQLGTLCYLPRPDWLSPLLDEPMTIHLVCHSGPHRSAGAQAFLEEAKHVATELQSTLADEVQLPARGAA
jgi:LysR family transcriptional regulator, regulator for genes of the gallate degradation pathway